MNWSCARLILSLRRSDPAGKLYRLIGVIALIFMISCTGDRPDDLIDEDTYIDILVEIHILQVINSQFEDEQKTLEAQQVVLDEYGITKEQFEASHDWYMQDVDAQRDRISEARSRMEDELTYLNERMMELREQEYEQDSSQNDEENAE